MAFLLDTHTFLWFLSGDEKLSKKALVKMLDINKKCYLSIASLWEITIKLQLGKLELNFEFYELAEYLKRNHIEILTINFDHLIVLSELPLNHRDPFDRIIISQAIAEKFTIISQDSTFKTYQAKLLW
ncbi:MAG: type II toxin-antitoxin system VapC family toxin [Candidatus Methylacidiphilales bacterium]